jgi:hypothetical protein
MLEFIYTGR